MAIKYYDLNAGVNGNGDYATPYNNRNNAQSAAGVNGSIVLKNGSYDFADHLDFDDAATDRAESKFGATLTTNSNATYIARVSSNGAMTGDVTQTVSGFVFDAPNSSSTPARCFELSQNSPHTGIINVNSCKFLAGSVTGLYVDIRNATTNVTDCEFEGSSSNGEIYGTSNLSSVADQAINVVGCKFTTAASTNTQGAKVTKANSNTYELDTSFRNCTFNAAPTGSAGYTALNLKVASATVSGCTFNLDGTQTSASMAAVYVIGQTTAQITEAYISNNTVTSSAKSGYMLSLGATDLSSYVTGGFIEANHVKGTYFTTYTPHGILLGMGSSGGVVRNNVVENIYAGILASKCTNGTISNNLLYNCYGPSLYIKGTTDITVANNTVVVGQDCTASDDVGVAPIGVNEQVDGTDTTGSTIENNTVIIPDISFVQGLASVSLNQTTVFKNNTYIIPDTVDLTSDLFCVGAASLSANAPNTTIAEWNALSATANGTGNITVTNDVIIQLPKADIDILVANLKPVSGGGTGEQSIISHNIIKH